jgi:hypothetical protein
LITGAEVGEIFGYHASSDVIVPGLVCRKDCSILGLDGEVVGLGLIMSVFP